MKNTLLATVFAVASSAAFAGGLDKPIYTPTIVAPSTVEADAVETGSDEWALALMTFLTIVLLGVGG